MKCALCGEDIVKAYGKKYCGQRCYRKIFPCGPCSEETKKKISESRKGKVSPIKGIKKSEEFKEKLKLAWIWRRQKGISEETREKMREAHKGEKSWNWKGGDTANKKRKYENLSYRLNLRISCLIRNNLIKGSKQGVSWQILLGYSNEDLKKRLSSTMPDGYSWDDFLSGNLHIDHIIPKSAFNYTLPEHIDFKKCWALDNLRLLPKAENLSKGKKLLHPHQPSLLL